VRELALAGCQRDEIAAELQISDELMREPDVRKQMDVEVKRGAARLRVLLRKLVIRLSTGRLKGASVMALLNMLRNMLDWDRARARDDPGRELLEAGSTGLEKLRAALDKAKTRRPT